MIATVYYSITAASSLSDLPAWNDVQGFFRLMGICIFSINGIGVTLPVENNMRKPKYFKTVLLWGERFVRIATDYIYVKYSSALVHSIHN